MIENIKPDTSFLGLISSALSNKGDSNQVTRHVKTFPQLRQEMFVIHVQIPVLKFHPEAIYTNERILEIVTTPSCQINHSRRQESVTCE